MPGDPNVANALAGVASAASILMWLSPIRAIWTSKDSIYHTQSSERVNTAFGFVAGAVQCALWVMYNTTHLDTMLIPLFVNSFGCLLNASFVACYWYYSQGAQRSVVQTQTAVLSPSIAFGIATWAYYGNSDLVGYFAVAVNILMYFGPLAAAGEVIRKRSNEGMIFSQLALTLVASVLWFSFGLYIQDVPVMIPNALGAVFAVMQITLFYWAQHAQFKQFRADLQQTHHSVRVSSSSSSADTATMALNQV